MKTTLLKFNYLQPAFTTTDGKTLATRKSGHIRRARMLPKKFTPGADYGITMKDGLLRAAVLKRAPGKTILGGFHVGLDGLIVRHSIWDRGFRPKCADPRAMVFVPTVGWVDIYLLNDRPYLHGTSSAGKQIADRLDPPTFKDGEKASNLNWWTASAILAEHGKMLLSREEFTVAMEGVAEGKNNGVDPEKTGHSPGLKSKWGIEQATGCMYVWTRDINPQGPWVYLAGGYWASRVAGPRRFSDDVPGDFWDGFGARGRCDHLFPDPSEAKA